MRFGTELIFGAFPDQTPDCKPELCRGLEGGKVLQWCDRALDVTWKVTLQRLQSVSISAGYDCG